MQVVSVASIKDKYPNVRIFFLYMEYMYPWIWWHDFGHNDYIITKMTCIQGYSLSDGETLYYQDYNIFSLIEKCLIIEGIFNN